MKLLLLKVAATIEYKLCQYSCSRVLYMYSQWVFIHLQYCINIIYTLDSFYTGGTVVEQGKSIFMNILGQQRYTKQHKPSRKLINKILNRNKGENETILRQTNYYIPAKPLLNHNIVSVHFNHFPCIGICDKLSRHLSTLAYIYPKVVKCYLTSSVPQQKFKFHMSPNYANI